MLGTAVALSNAGMTEPNRSIGNSLPKGNASSIFSNSICGRLELSGSLTLTFENR